MKKLLFLVLAACMIGGCSGTKAEKNDQGADTVKGAISGEAVDGGSKPVAGGVSGKGPVETDSENGKDAGPGETVQKDSESGSKPYLDTTKLQNTYGFADNTGRYILSYDNTENADLNKAIGKNGQVLSVKFVKKQAQGSQDNGRQTANNFHNVPGLLFEVEGGNAQPNETYYLASGEAFNVESLLKVKEVNAEGADDALKRNIEEAKSQKIEKIWKIADIEPEQAVYLVRFQKQGRQVTASLVLVQGDRIAAKDFTADYDPISTWRVDDGGEILPEMFSFLFAASSREGTVLAVAWSGAEGENDNIYKQQGTELVDLNLSSGRYMVP
ncbi:hypothetical protein RJP21_12140 [Paenibacillus sp. VCA1]|uniref:hypothetical protein n=1 Tax=Paenibacillus sp. VCA1 TaxID=3039148 RepID=UPI0028723968|nr:hypothetical protein [Paenibacillus sp. VCA1]MDR9854354.1 hypothetical protein [Paenibacillus sp. VCA1]